MIPGALAFVAGVALMALPAVLGSPRPAADLLHVVGPIAAALGFVSISEVLRGMRRLNVLAAAALAIGSPLVGMTAVGLALAWLGAAVLAATAVVGPGVPRDRYGGGWRSLLG